MPWCCPAAARPTAGTASNAPGASSTNRPPPGRAQRPEYCVNWWLNRAGHLFDEQQRADLGQRVVKRDPPPQRVDLPPQRLPLGIARRAGRGQRLPLLSHGFPLRREFAQRHARRRPGAGSAGRRARTPSGSPRPTSGVREACRSRPASANPIRSVPARSTAAGRAAPGAGSFPPLREDQRNAEHLVAPRHTAGCSSGRPSRRPCRASSSRSRPRRRRRRGSLVSTAASPPRTVRDTRFPASDSSTSACAAADDAHIGHDPQAAATTFLTGTDQADFFAAVDADGPSPGRFHDGHLRSRRAGDQREAARRGDWPAEPLRRRARWRCRRRTASADRAPGALPPSSPCRSRSRRPRPWRSAAVPARRRPARRPAAADRCRTSARFRISLRRRPRRERSRCPVCRPATGRRPRCESGCTGRGDRSTISPLAWWPKPLSNVFSPIRIGEPVLPAAAAAVSKPKSPQCLCMLQRNAGVPVADEVRVLRSQGGRRRQGDKRNASRQDQGALPPMAGAIPGDGDRS